MKIRKLIGAMGMGLALGGAAGVSQAAEMSVYAFQDDDIDFVLTVDANNNFVPKTSGQVEVGDIFFSVFEIPTFTRDGVDGIPDGKELTGIAATQLVDLILSDVDGDGTVDNGALVFAPYEGGLNSLLQNITDQTWSLPGGDVGEGAMIAMFFNDALDPSESVTDRDLVLDVASNPASNCTSLADCAKEATQGTLYQVDGFQGDSDEFWVATFNTLNPVGPDNDVSDLAVIAGLNNTISYINVTFALSNFYQFNDQQVGWLDITTGLQNATCNAYTGYVDGDGCVQITGSGALQGGQGLTNGAVAHSDFDARKYVPEPATLLLLGAGMLGLGWSQRRRSA